MVKIQLCITGINYILKYIKIQTVILNCNNILQNNSFFSIFDQINKALMTLVKYIKNLTDPKLLNDSVYSDVT